MIRRTLHRYRLHQANQAIGRKLGEMQRQATATRLPIRPKQPWSIEVLIPAYNHANYLPITLASALAQDYEGAFKIRVIDDCSTDDTEKIVKDMARSKNVPARVKISYEKNPKNLRQCGSINRALKASDSDIVVVLNDDDALTPDALTKITKAFEEHSGIFLVGATSIWFHEDTTVTNFDTDELAAKSQELKIYPSNEVVHYTGLNDLNMTHSSMAFFRVAWEAVGGYSEKADRIHPEANEDRDFQMRVNALFPVAVYTDYPLAFWRTDSSHGKDY